MTFKMQGQTTVLGTVTEACKVYEELKKSKTKVIILDMPVHHEGLGSYIFQYED